MRKILCILFVLGMVFGLVACAETGNPTQQGDTDQPFPGKIAIITNTVSQNEEEYRSAEDFTQKYGADKIIHYTWPDNFMAEQEQMVSTVAKVAADKDIRVLVINQAVPGTNASVDKLLETRDDMFIVYSNAAENQADAAARADLLLGHDSLAMGPAMVQQAYAQGAKVMVHYSFPRHLSNVLTAARRDLMKAECDKLGMTFVDATAPDPTGDAGTTGAQQFILEDVPKMVQEYGKDTAFFSTNCSMQTPLITKIVELGAVYPQPCCPSPFHGFPAALGIETTEENKNSIEYIVNETNRIVHEKGVEGRLSTWPVPESMMNTYVGVEYGILWLNGKVPKDGTIDAAALAKVAEEYAKIPVTYNAYEENGQVFQNFQMIIMDYLTFDGKYE